MRRPTPPTPVKDLDWSPERAAEMAQMTSKIWTEWLGKLPQLPVARHESSHDVRTAVGIEVPDEPMDPRGLEDHLRDIVFQHSMYPGHPGFLAYVSGAGTVPGAAADLLASGINQNSGGWRLSPAASEIEQHLVEWFAAKFGMPYGSTGFIASGGAMANLVGVQLARLRKAGWNVRKEGVRAGPPLRLYVSTETHVTVDRAAEVAGIGRDGVTHIEVDDELRMDVSALRAAIETDIASGVKPIGVVGTAGTTGTGSIDPLQEIADVCSEFDLWFHVDAAYGGAAALTEELAPQFVGIERADSLGFDPHKWLYTPIAGACVIVRDPAVLADAFGVQASYVLEGEEHTGWGRDMAFLSPNFTRHFGAFKIWVSLLAHGWKAFQRRIVHDVELTKYLQALVEAHPELELVSPQRLSITTFRYVPPGLPSSADNEAYLDELNTKIMYDLEFAGSVYPSNAVVAGRFAIRSCIVNFRTEAAEMETLVAEAVEFGRKRHSEAEPGPT